MISVDTNIVVRFLTGDDYSQFERAKKLFREKEIFIAHVCQRWGTLDIMFVVSN